MRRFVLIGGILAVALAISAASLAAAAPDAIQQARQATARFNSTVQAEKAGYGPFPPGVPLHECIMALDATGGMGFHWVNGALLDDELHPASPEVLVYAPKANGGLELVALEYVIFDSAVPAGTTPRIFGRDLTFVPDGNRYEIPAFWQRHIWLYDRNPAGLFNDFNPTISC
jgi:hypothetical protein